MLWTGRSSSADRPCPPARIYYPDFDYLHLGELGDATEALIETLTGDCTRPAQQIRFKTVERRPLGAFPMPAYELAKIDRYFLGTIQFSSGCPYTCEFCDIPGLYGRVPRLKTPAQITAELDRLLELGHVGSIYFVDDNLVANRRALKDLLPHLVAWQKANGYAFSFACEATLNIARYPDILAMMREAAFESIFCGIETPEPEALIAIDKGQNNQLPILDGVRIINEHGMQVVSGIILGLDTDTPETGRKLLDFIELSKIPMLTINLLQALPQTPLWTRLEKAGRIEHDEELESNVRFALPYDLVLKMWRECMAAAYLPNVLFDRYRHQMKAVWPNRLKRPNSRQRMSPRNIKKALAILARVTWFVGIRGDYKREFWRFSLPLLLRGEIEGFFFCVLPAHHLIRFARDATSGRSNASYYSAKISPLPTHAMQP